MMICSVFFMKNLDINICLYQDMEGSTKLEQGGTTSEHIQVIAMDAMPLSRTAT